MRLHRRSHFIMTAIAAIALVATASPALASTSDSGRVLVPVGSAPLFPHGASTLGALPSNEKISFDVVLKPRNRAALDAFVQQVSTPGSPQYRKFLQTGEFDARFGPTPTAIAEVQGELMRLGLRVDRTDGFAMKVSGTAKQVESALGVDLKQYRLPSGRIARANSATPRLPLSTASYVNGIVGLDTLAQVSRPAPAASSALTGTAGVRPHSAASPQPCVAASLTPGAPYTANELADYYGLSSYHDAGQYGSGITVALVEFEGYDPADIQAYQTCYGTSATVTAVDVDGGPGSNPMVGEAALDIEDIIGLAPEANIRVYQGSYGATVADVLDVYNAIATENVAQIVSTSWGLCEYALTDSELESEALVFQKMAAQGQTMFAASGDSGSADCYRLDNRASWLAVDDPAGQPGVIGVGGTSLQSLSGTDEVTWNNGKYYDATAGQYFVSATGGGESAFWARPSWQKVSGTYREVPDVSASADPNYGYAIYFNGAWRAYGGTSAAAPTWAALTALIASSCTTHRLGLLTPALYQLAEVESSVFKDITSGDNDGSGTNGGQYAAGPGYDMATGLGSPKGATLGANLCPAADGAGSMNVSPSTVPALTRQTLTFTYTAPATQALIDGKLTLQVPVDDGWPTPSTSPSADGYTTASAGIISVSGSVITVSGVATAAGGTVTITYGSTSGTGHGVTAPKFGGPSTFGVKQSATSAGTLTALSVLPEVDVQGPARDGSGTMMVSPSAVTAGTTGTLMFTYTPPEGATLTSGEIDVQVPPDWSQPSANSADPGYVMVSGGTGTNSLSVPSGPVVGPWQIQITDVTLASGQTLTVKYGDTSGGGPGVVAPPNGGPSTFAANQKATSAGTLKVLTPSPQVIIKGPAADGSGSITVSPPSVTTRSSVTMTFVYSAPVGATVTGGEVNLTVPTTWTSPSHDTPGAGYVTASTSGGGTPTVAVSGSTIKVTGVTLAENEKLTIVYGDTSGGGAKATAPSSAETSIFNAAMGYSTPPTNLAVSPTVTVQSPPPPPSGGGSPVGHPTLQRVYGSDRIATSIAASKAAFPNDSSAHVVVLARSDSYADALAGTPLAAAKNGPLLLTLSTSLPDPVVGEIGRVLPIGGTIYILGGTAAINSSIQTELAGFGYNVQRLAGNSRYETAVAIAAALGNPSTVFEADGTNFPDALSAGSAAVHEGGVVLLTSGTTMPAATAAYLVAHPSTRYAIGGPAAKADPGAQKFVGADRYATSVLVAQRFFQAPISVGLASGQTFPDALSGGVVASLYTGPMILVPKSGNVPSGTLSYLTFAGNSASKAWLFGGTASVDDVVFLQAADALKPGSTTTVIG